MVGALVPNVPYPQEPPSHCHGSRSTTTCAMCFRRSPRLPCASFTLVTRTFPQPGTWRRTSRGRGSWSCPGRPTLSSSVRREEALAEIQEFLTGVRPAPEPSRVLATVLFADIVTRPSACPSWETGFGAICSRPSSQRFAERSNGSTDGRSTLRRWHLRGVRRPRSGGALRVGDMRSGSRGRSQVRVGVHTGECERVENRLRGVAVHIGARISSLAAPGGVLVSEHSEVS